ncbi:hypothetical protein ACWEV4_33675, partial [Streptomyces sp. NPDC003860]
MPKKTTRVLITNLKGNGGPPHADGSLPKRWHDAYHGLYKDLDLDLILVAENTHAQWRPGDPDDVRRAADRRFAAAEDALGMEGFRAPLGLGSNPTALFVSKRTFKVWKSAPRGNPYGHCRTPATQVVLTLRDWPRHLQHIPPVPITVVSVHSAFNSPPKREAEAYDLTQAVDGLKLHIPERERRGLWIGGDFN